MYDLSRLAPRLIAILVSLAGLPVWGQPAQTPDPDAMLRRIDAAQHPIAEGTVRLRVTVHGGKQPTEVSELVVYIQGTEHILCRFLTGKFQGRLILIREDLGKVWLITPGTTRAIPITASQLLVGGASIADVARRRLSGHYGVTVRPKRESVDGVDCRVLDLVALSPQMTYATAVWWVGSRDGLPRKARLFLRSGKESKELRFLEYDRRHGEPRVSRMEIVHLLRKERGMITTLEFLEYRDRTLDPHLFELEGAPTVN